MAAMKSITKPFLTQIKTLQSEYDRTIKLLEAGDSRAKESIAKLGTEARKLFAGSDQLQAQLEAMGKSAVDSLTSVSTATNANQAGMISLAATIAFLIQEVTNLLKIISALSKLISNIMGLQPLIAAMIGSIKTVKATLSVELVTLEKKINRAKQKAAKNMEWLDTAARIAADELLEKSKLQLYQNQLRSVQGSSTVSNAQRTYLNNAIAISTRIINVEIPSRKKALTDDKKAWEDKWAKEVS